MFREDYIKDNDRIKPDEEFLTRLKESVAEEKQSTQTPWLKWGTLVAALALVCVLGYMAGGFTNTDALKGNVESSVKQQDDAAVQSQDAQEQDSKVSDACQEQYGQVIRLFQKLNVSIYQIDAFEMNGDALQELTQDEKNQNELSHEQRDELVGNILAEKYTLAETTELFQTSEYYVAEFEDGTCVYFVVGDEEYIFIEKVSEIQSVACLD